MIASSVSAHRAKRNSAKKPPRPIVSSSIGCARTARRAAFHFMRELSVDLLEDFKVEGLPDSMAATSKAQVTAKIRCFLREAYRRSWTQFALAEKVRPYRATRRHRLFSSIVHARNR